MPFCDRNYTKLGEITTCVLGGTPSRDNKNYWNGNIPWINSGEVNNFRIIEGIEYITELGLKKSSTELMPKNTTVIAITGATLGQISLLLIDCCANQSVIGIKETDELPYNFIYPFIKFELFELLKKQTGGAQQHINKQNVEDIIVSLPNKEILNDYVQITNPLFKEIEVNCFEIKKLEFLKKIILTKISTEQ